MTQKKLLLIVNPRAGRSKSRSPLFDAMAVFSEAGYLISVHKTSAPRDAVETVARSGDQYDLIVAAGGDGTRNGQYVLHRIVKAADTYTCIGDNQFEKEPGLTHDQMIALVTAFYRGEKRREVDSWQYWLYCRFWHFSRPVRRIWLGVKARLRRLIKK